MYERIQTEFDSFLGPLSQIKRLMILFALVVILIGMSFLIYLSNYSKWIVLKSDLDPVRSEFILKTLHDENIPAYIESGGSAIFVDQDFLDKADKIIEN